MSTPIHMYEVYIKTTPEELWQAITDSNFTRDYFGGSVESDWQPGSEYRYANAEGGAMHYGTIIESDPPRRLVQTFEHDYSDDHGGGPDDKSRVTWQIEPLGEVCKLTLTHDQWAGETKSYTSAAAGWPMILSGLKTLLETRAPLPIPAM